MFSPVIVGLKPNLLLPEIHIQIDKNTKNPYAVLRSELEHARDIAKREVPNQSEKHFARYKGKNESEMSLGYVKKKADTRASKAVTEKNLDEINKKYDFEDINSTPETHTNHNDLNENTITVKSRDGKDLAQVIYYNSGDKIFISDMQNYKIERGAGRAAIAKLAEKFPDKTIDWVAISEGSTKSYKEFCKEYPELAKRVQFEDRVLAYKTAENATEAMAEFYNEDEKQAILDEVFNDSYNSEKGAITDERGTNSQDPNRRNAAAYTARRNNDGSNGLREGRTEAQSNQDGSPHKHLSDDSVENINRERTSPDSINKASNESGEVSRTLSRDNRGNASTSVSDGNLSPEERIINSNGNIEEISKALDDTNLNLDPQTFKNLGKNSDEVYNQFINSGVTDLTGLKEAFAQGDVNYVNVK